MRWSALPCAHARRSRPLRHRASRSEALFVEVDDAWGAWPGEWLGALAELEGDLDTAEKVLASGRTRRRTLGLWRQVASRLGLLGGSPTAARTGRGGGPGRTGAAPAVEQADRSLEVLAVMVLGFTARQSGDLAGAEAHLRSRLDGSRGRPRRARVGARRGRGPPPQVVTVLAELGSWPSCRGQPARSGPAPGRRSRRWLGAGTDLAGASKVGRRPWLPGAAQAAGAGAGRRGGHPGRSRARHRAAYTPTGHGAMVRRRWTDARPP